MDPYEILLHPYVTEKSLNFLSGTPSQDLKDGNRIEFVVKKTANKAEIKKAFEKLFEAKVDNVRTFIRRDGKHAIIKLREGFSAEDIGMRIGVF